MSAFPTGNELADVNILLQLSDQELGRACQTDTYTNRLCQNDLLWKWRLEQRYPHLLPLRANFSSYHELYQLAIHGTFAVSIGEHHLRLYNNIQDAYQEFVGGLRIFLWNHQLQSPSLERANELVNILGVARFPYRLYFLGLGEISLGDPRRILIDLGTDQIIVQPNLSKMPTFNPSIFVSYALDNSSRIGVGLPSNEVFEYLNQAAQTKRLPKVGFAIQRSDNQASLEFRWFMPDIFVSVQNHGATILGKVNGRFMITQLSQQQLRQVLLVPTPTSRGIRVFAPRTSDLLTLLPQIYGQLPWEPLENIVNYL